MIALNPANGIAQIATIYEQPELSWDEKALLCCLFARLYAAKSSLPIPTLAQTLKMPVQRVLALSTSLRRHAYVKILTQDDGQHAVLNIRHPIFEMRTRSGDIERIIKTSGKVPTSANLLSYWRSAYYQAFKKFPPREQKDLLRMRYVVRKQGEDAMQAVNDHINRYRNVPMKCTTLGLFLAYGQSSKV